MTLKMQSAVYSLAKEIWNLQESLYDLSQNIGLMLHLVFILPNMYQILLRHTIFTQV